MVDISRKTTSVQHIVGQKTHIMKLEHKRPDSLLRAVVVQRELLSNDGLSIILEKYFPEIEIVALVKDAFSAAGIISLLDPDVIFLEVDLKDGCGFQVMDSLRNRSNYQVIISSKEKKHAAKAISYGATDFLLKPFELENVVLALKKLKDLQSVQKRKKRKSSFYQDSKINEVETELMALPSTGKVDLIKKRDIIYLKADGRYTSFFLDKGRSILVSKNIGELEEFLRPPRFIRVHHSYIVNIMKVTCINRASGNYLEFESASPIPVAKRKLDTLSRFLKIK